MSTLEQEQQWRADFNSDLGTSNICGRHDYAREYLLQGYLAGREAQQREDAEKIRLRDSMLDITKQEFRNASSDLHALQGKYFDQQVEIGQWKNLCEGNDHKITQLQARVKELESRLAAGEPPLCYVSLQTVSGMTGKVRGRGGEGIFKATRDKQERYGFTEPLYTHEPTQPPAAQVPDEPVAWRSRHVNYVGWTLSEWELPMREGQEQQPLYLDQRCAAIPDYLHMRDVTHPKATNPEEAWMYATGWNACRAAMLASTPEKK